MLERIEEVVKDVLGKWDGELIEFGGEADHIHILFEAIPSIDLSKLVNNFKSVSSRRLRAEYQEHLKRFYWGDKPQFWSGSYAIISVGALFPAREADRVRPESRKARVMMLRPFRLVSLTLPKS